MLMYFVCSTTNTKLGYLTGRGEKNQFNAFSCTLTDYLFSQHSVDALSKHILNECEW